MGKLAVCKFAVESVGAELENGLIALLALEPGFVCVFRNKVRALEKCKTMLHASCCAKRVAPGASGVASRNGEASLGFGLLRCVKEVGTHLENLVVRHVQKAKTTTSNAGVKPENQIGTVGFHGRSSDRLKFGNGCLIISKV